MKKTTKDIREESKKIFLEYVGENSNLRLLYFHTFLCPIAMAEAMVKEHIIEVSPESTYISDVEYGNEEYKISKKMMNLFPLETLVFVGKDSLIKVKNVTEVIPVACINWNNFPQIFSKNNFKKHIFNIFLRYNRHKGKKSGGYYE